MHFRYQNHWINHTYSMSLFFLFYTHLVVFVISSLKVVLLNAITRGKNVIIHVGLNST
uniref:Uncharacterized protein n=1 Tax=Anguilla anguilla TaxID=7936 RepID=A0A0E9UKW1_ANGAN